MIYKSYLIEKNISIIKQSATLFYGENLGLINDFKNKIKENNKHSKIIRYDQENILSDSNAVFSEIFNISLFEEEKIYFIDFTNEKLLNFIEEITSKNTQNKIYFFSGLLDKRSKIRNFFEKSNSLATVPCYQDNEITIKKIVHDQLRDFKGITPSITNLIIDSSNLDRIKLNNELQKIKTFFFQKSIDESKLIELLDLKLNEDFSQLRDAALSGDKIKTNKLLSETVIDGEKNIYYITLLSQRFNKLKQIKNIGNNDLQTKIDTLKPPIFWKDKPAFIRQAKKWCLEKISKIEPKMYKLEVTLKSNSDINKEVLLKSLVIDICRLANS
tara:strand:+ start:5983 stop:6969 length:987 start_codon:yes stop_codon:yes gene_type:complete